MAPDLMEADRLATLRDYALLDTAPEPQFDVIVREAAEQLGTPIATLSLVDERRQWFKARRGLEASETPVTESICAHAIRSDEAVFVVPDIPADDRFRSFSSVTGDPHIRFYAGVPLTMRNGARLGTLCVIDVEARSRFDDEERALLSVLARRAVAAIELRRDIRAGVGAQAAAPERAVLLGAAEALLDEASAALDQVGATSVLARLEGVLAEVAQLRQQAAVVSAG